MNRHDSNDRAVFEVLDVLVRFRWRFILPAFGVTVLILLGSLALPKKYQAHALFESEQDVVLSEIGGGRQGASDAYQRSPMVQMRAIASDPAVDQLMRDIKPRLKQIEGFSSESEIEALRSRVRTKVVVQNEISSQGFDRVRLHYTDRDPRVAAMVVNGLVENYISKSRNKMNRSLVESREFFRREVDRYQQRIETLEDELLKFEIDNAQLLPENPNSVQAQVQRLELQLEDLRGEKDAIGLRIASIRRMLDEEPETVPSLRKAKNPELIRLEVELRELESRRHEYISVYKMKPAHPDLQNVEQQIALTRKQMAETDTEVVVGRDIANNPKRDELELRISEAQADKQAVTQRIEAVKSQIAKIGESLPEVLPVRTRARKLQRDVDQARAQLTFWEERLRRVDLSLTAEDGERGLNLNFVRPARASGRPISPRMTQVMLAAVLLGIVAGSLSVFFSYRTDDTCASGHRLAAETRLALLGTVSELVTRSYERRRRIRRMILYPINAAAMIAVLVVVIHVVHRDLESIEEFDTPAASPAAAPRPLDGAGTAAAALADAPFAEPRLADVRSTFRTRQD